MIPDAPPSASMFAKMADEHKLTMSVAELRKFVRNAYDEGFTDGVNAEKCDMYLTIGKLEREREAAFSESETRKCIERAIDVWGRYGAFIDIRLTKDEMPNVGQPVIVSGGAARWDGAEWQTLNEPGFRTIQWPVLWWAPFPGNEAIYERMTR